MLNFEYVIRNSLIRNSLIVYPTAQMYLVVNDAVLPKSPGLTYATISGFFFWESSVLWNMVSKGMVREVVWMIFAICFCSSDFLDFVDEESSMLVSNMIL